MIFSYKCFIFINGSLLNEHIKVEVFDPSGRRVYLKEFSNIKSNSEIATGNLNGLYLVSVSARERLYQERVLLMK